MHFFNSLPYRHLAVDRSPSSALAGAISALAASDDVRKRALALASHLRLEEGASGLGQVRALHDGGIEAVVVSAGIIHLEPFSPDPAVTVVTDHWRDDRGDCALLRVLHGHRAVDLSFGVIERAMADAPFSGDTWALSTGLDGLTVLVLDGLGHGPLAQNAALAGVEVMRGTASVSPSEDLRHIHEALKGTVGAVAAVARVTDRGVVDFSGIGNIEAALVSGTRRVGLASYPGIVGQGKPSFRLFRHVLSDETHLILHTDGVRTRWTPVEYPGLFTRHPALIAAVLFRDWWRQSDDALMMVLKIDDDAHRAFARVRT